MVLSVLGEVELIYIQNTQMALYYSQEGRPLTLL